MKVGKLAKERLNEWNGIGYQNSHPVLCESEWSAALQHGC